MNDGALSTPEVFKPPRRHFGVPDRVLDILMAQVGLQRSRVVPFVGQGVAAGVGPQISAGSLHDPPRIIAISCWSVKAARQKYGDDDAGSDRKSVV